MKKIMLLGYLILTATIFGKEVFTNPIVAEEPAVVHEVQHSPEQIVHQPWIVYFPNGGANALGTPTGWGAYGNTIYAGAGGTYKQRYKDDADGGAAVGIGLGDPFEWVGLESTYIFNNIDRLDQNHAASFKLHKYLGYGISVSFGIENAWQESGNDGNKSHYIAISRAAQNLESKYTPGKSRLHYTFGYGDGRFNHISPDDENRGKSNHATGFFMSTAYEVYKNTNFILEWDGVNANAGFGITPFEKIPVAFTLSAAELFRGLSGDKVRAVGSISAAYQF